MTNIRYAHTTNKQTQYTTAAWQMHTGLHAPIRLCMTLHNANVYTALQRLHFKDCMAKYVGNVLHINRKKRCNNTRRSAHTSPDVPSFFSFSISAINPSCFPKAKRERLHRFGITAQDIANLRQDARIVQLLGILCSYVLFLCLNLCLEVTLMC